MLDANDKAPRFDVTSYGADVIENSFIGTFVTRVRATDDDDGDNGLVHYIVDEYRGTADHRDSGLVHYILDDGREKTRRQKDSRKRYGVA